MIRSKLAKAQLSTTLDTYHHLLCFQMKIRVYLWLIEVGFGCPIILSLVNLNMLGKKHNSYVSLMEVDHYFSHRNEGCSLNLLEITSLYRFIHFLAIKGKNIYIKNQICTWRPLETGTRRSCAPKRKRTGALTCSYYQICKYVVAN